MHRTLGVVFTAFITALVAVPAAQAPATPTGRDEVIRAIGSRFETTYVFPDVAARVGPELEKRIKAGAYREITDGQAFADALTNDLRTITGDQHARVGYSKEPFPPMNEAPQSPAPRSADEIRRQLAAVNYGFLKVERLPGNIGFLDLDFFADPEFGGATAVAAMSFVADTDALIVDLRFNGGGNSRMVALIASYLFESDPQHLNDIVVPRENLLKQSWTLPYVEGRKFGRAKPVYILTSAKTFSAAEEFAYDGHGAQRIENEGRQRWRLLDTSPHENAGQRTNRVRQLERQRDAPLAFVVLGARRSLAGDLLDVVEHRAAIHRLTDVHSSLAIRGDRSIRREMADES